jgi:hypothetical protein
VSRVRLLYICGARARLRGASSLGGVLFRVFPQVSSELIARARLLGASSLGGVRFRVLPRVSSELIGSVGLGAKQGVVFCPLDSGACERLWRTRRCS